MCQCRQSPKSTPVCRLFAGQCLALVLPVACPVRLPQALHARRDAPQALTTAGGIEMVALPGGWFEMGARDADEPDQQLHKVFVSPLAIDKYPVTQQEYEKQWARTRRTGRGRRTPWSRSAGTTPRRTATPAPVPKGSRWPTIPRRGSAISSADGYRLPTEAEYEYALRAGTTTAYFFGDSPADLPRYAWFKANSTRGPHPVGKKPANAWGLCDMVGNVWQWCNDYYQEDYYKQSPDRDPRGPARGEARVVRGGCWNSKPDDLRSAYRNYETPAYTDICFAKDIHGQVGFRCVRRQAGK